METYITMSKKESIKRIQEMPDDTIFMLTINFDEGVSDTGKHISKKRGAEIIEEARLRVLSGNKYMSKIDLYSVFQPDIYNIKPMGVMKTILLDGIKK